MKKGGKREGSGRKKKFRTEAITIRFTKEEIKEIKETFELLDGCGRPDKLIEIFRFFRENRKKF